MHTHRHMNTHKHSHLPRRYERGPAPPMEEFAELTGHASYDLIVRDGNMWNWLARQTTPVS